jgi:hypothetical protein
MNFLLPICKYHHLCTDQQHCRNATYVETIGEELLDELLEKGACCGDMLPVYFE